MASCGDAATDTAGLERVAALERRYSELARRASVPAMHARLCGGATTAVDWAQWRLLTLLLRGPARNGELADRAGLSPSTAQHQLEHLAATGLVKSKIDRRDHRARVSSLTPRGRRVVDELRRARCEAIQDALSGWSDEDLSLFANLLLRLEADLAAWFARRDAANARCSAGELAGV